jgi:histidine triad (HIT) family protein
MTACAFCNRISARDYDKGFSAEGFIAVFEPLNPVTPGHLLVIPWKHIADAAADPPAAGRTLEYAADLVQRLGYPANIITSIGDEATQTVFHMHFHIVPRRDGDGLHLPWTGQDGAT